MDIFTAIKTRRSIVAVKPDPVPTEMIEKILEAGTWAPCHYRTEPWRFFVLTGEARNRLGETIAAYAKKTIDDLESEEGKQKLAREEQKPLRAPVIIAVAAEPVVENKRVLVNEEFAAVHAAVQNMLLAAHAQGLGAIWRTGKVCYSTEVKELFGLTGQSEMVGFIYVGYPDMEKEGRRKKGLSEVTKWLDKSEDYPLK